MNAASAMRVWWFLILLLGIEAGVVAAVYALLARNVKNAVWRRTCAQAAVAGVLLIALFEISGIGRGVAGWAKEIGERRMAKTSAHEEKKAGVGVMPTGVQLKESFRSEVAARLAQIQESKPAALFVPTQTKPDPSLQPMTATFEARTVRPRQAEAPHSLAALWLFLIWIGGAALVAARAFLGRCLFALFRFRRRRVTDTQVMARVESLSKRIRCARAVRVVESARLASPIAFGIFRPTIGLPPKFAERFSAGQQEAMLAHELAHLAAHDPFWCLAADAASALLWWHPMVWWLRRELRLASELAADEASLVVANGPGLLAECLVEIGSLMSRTPLLGQLQMAGFNSCLGRRVQRLVNLESGSWKPPRRLRSILATIFGPLACALAMILCTGWVIPGSLLKGETMKSIQLNWKNSLATLALLGSVNMGSGTEAESSGTTQTLRERTIVRSESTLKPALSEIATKRQEDLAALERQLKAEYEKVNELSRKYTDLSPAMAEAGEKLRALEKQMSEAGGQRLYAASTPPGAPGAAPVVPQETPPGTIPDNDYARRYQGARRLGDLATASGHRERGGQLESKLEKIVLSEVSFDNLPLSEVLKFLNEESRKHDHDKKGINFLINPNPPMSVPAGNGSPIDPATGLPMPTGATEAVDVGAVTIKINMPLRDVTMLDVLDAIVKVADRPIKYSLEDYAVVFSPRGEFAMQPMVPSAPRILLSVRTFKVDTNTFVPGLESAFGIKIDSAKGDWSKNDPATRSRKIQAALKELLTQLGVSMEGNKAVFYNELTGIVMARATYDDLDVFHAAISTLGGEIVGPFGDNPQPGRGFGSMPFVPAK